MPDLSWVEVPRHVHRRDGTSTIVQTHDELVKAVADGWLIDPNQPADVAPEPEPVVEDVPADDAAEPEPEPEPEAAPKTKRGRPRKGA